MKGRSRDREDRLPVVDLVRTAAILLVLTAHFFSCATDLDLSGRSSDIFRRLGFLFESGRYGVTMFFVVSGFLITRVLAGMSGGLFRAQAREFYARRCGRILPLLFLALAIGACAWAMERGMEGPRIAHSFGTGNGEATALFWAALLFFQLNWYRIFHPIQGLHWEVLWSLSIEEQFYLFYPLLLSILRSVGRLKKALVGIVLSGIAWRVLAGSHVGPAVYGSFGNFDAIAMGALLFLVLEEQGDLLRKRPGLCRVMVLGGGAGLLSALACTNPYRDKDLGPTLVAGFLFILLLGALPLGPFGGKAARALFLPGRLSYGCYLLHPTALYLLWPWMAGRPWFAAYPMFIAGVVGISWVSFRWFETPMNRLFRRAFLRIWAA